MKTTVLSLAIVSALISTVFGGPMITPVTTTIALPGGATAVVVPDKEVKGTTVGDFGWVCTLVQEEEVYYCEENCWGEVAVYFERWACLPGDIWDYCDETPMLIFQCAPCIFDIDFDCTITEWTYVYDLACG